MKPPSPGACGQRDLSRVLPSGDPGPVQAWGQQCGDGRSVGQELLAVWSPAQAATPCHPGCLCRVGCKADGPGSAIPAHPGSSPARPAAGSPDRGASSQPRDSSAFCAPACRGRVPPGPAPGTGGSLDSEEPDGGTCTPSQQEPRLCLTSAPGATRPAPAARGHSLHGPPVVPGPGVVHPHEWDLAGAGSPWCSLGRRVVGSG